MWGTQSHEDSRGLEVCIDCTMVVGGKWEEASDWRDEPAPDILKVKSSISLEML